MKSTLARFRAPVVLLASTLFVLLTCLACGGDGDDASADGARSGRPGGGGGGGAGRGGGRPGGFPGGPPSADAGVPVEVATAERQPIALYFETHGTLEAERDVELVARAAGPIVALEAEEGMQVRKGQLLARIDDSEIRTQLAVARVRLEEAEAAYDRARSLFDEELISREGLDTATASYETALGDVERTSILLEHTEIRAPFAGQIVTRFVRFAEYLNVGARLFRISDFDPLLCPIQVPERELRRLSVGQAAELEIEAWPERRFAALVDRVSPVVDAATGTVRVTLEVDGDGVLRPGMFAGVFLEMERRPQALVVPKGALSLDSLGDTVFVVDRAEKDGFVARRQAIEIGFENADLLEVTDGLAEGERVVVVGQDGLSDGTPIEILEGGARRAPPPVESGARGPPGAGRGGGGGGRGGPFADLDLDDPEQVERVKARMRERGLTDEQIEERLERLRQRRGGSSRGGDDGP